MTAHRARRPDRRRRVDTEPASTPDFSRLRTSDGAGQRTAAVTGRRRRLTGARRQPGPAASGCSRPPRRPAAGAGRARPTRAAAADATSTRRSSTCSAAHARRRPGPRCPRPAGRPAGTGPRRRHQRRPPCRRPPGREAQPAPRRAAPARRSSAPRRRHRHPPRRAGPAVPQQPAAASRRSAPVAAADLPAPPVSPGHRPRRRAYRLARRRAAAVRTDGPPHRIPDRTGRAAPGRGAGDPHAPEPAPPAGGHAAPPAHGRPARRPGKPPARKAATAAKPARQPQAGRGTEDQAEDRDPSIELAITEIAGHLTFTPNTVTAWYWLPEVRWAFRPDADREALLVAISEQYAGLAGFRLHLRRTTRPFPADEWARTRRPATPPGRCPTSPARRRWGDHLVGAQRHLLSLNHAEGQTFLGITFARRTLGDTFAERLRRHFRPGRPATPSASGWARTVEQFDEVLGAFGMRGRRVTAGRAGVAALPLGRAGHGPARRCSPARPAASGTAATCSPSPSRSSATAPRTASTVKLVNRLTGEERHVAVLTVGRMEPLEIPERHEPWLHFHERLPWPMEISVPGRRPRPRRLVPQPRAPAADDPLPAARLRRARHGRAARAGAAGPAGAGARRRDDHRPAGRLVPGARLAPARGRRRAPARSASNGPAGSSSSTQRELRISLQHPKSQDCAGPRVHPRRAARQHRLPAPDAGQAARRRAAPGRVHCGRPARRPDRADRRHLAAGRSSSTCTSRWRSGSAPAWPSSSPSPAAASPPCSARWATWPPGAASRSPCSTRPARWPGCAQMPELRPYSRVLNLTGSEQGTLAPYALIPTPQRGALRRRRRPATRSSDRGLQRPGRAPHAGPGHLLDAGAAAGRPRGVHRHRCCATPSGRCRPRRRPPWTTSSRCLQAMPATTTRRSWATCCSTPPRCRWPCCSSARRRPAPLGDRRRAHRHHHGRPAAARPEDRARVLVGRGAARPADAAHRPPAGRAPLLRRRHDPRKLVGLDEAHFMEGWRSGRSFLVRLARDSRKWNLAALVASQNPQDILGLDVQNLVSTVFVGRIAEDAEIAAEALRLLRVPVDDGYEAVLASLSQVGRRLVGPARLPRVRHARRRRPGAEDPRRRVVRRRAARPPGHHARRRSPRRPERLPSDLGRTWRP